MHTTKWMSEMTSTPTMDSDRQVKREVNYQYPRVSQSKLIVNVPEQLGKGCQYSPNPKACRPPSFAHCKCNTCNTTWQCHVQHDCGLGLSTLQRHQINSARWMWMTPRPLLCSPISCCNAERRCLQVRRVQLWKALHLTAAAAPASCTCWRSKMSRLHVRMRRT